jgi:hypothetical protein
MHVKIDFALKNKMLEVIREKQASLSLTIHG